MNVLLVIPFPTNGTAGVGRVVRSLQQSMSEQKHNGFLLIGSLNKRIKPATELGWEETYALNFHPLSVSRAPLKSRLAFWTFLVLQTVDLGRFLSRKRIDIVHVNYPTEMLIVFAILRIATGRKLVVTFHGSELNRLTSLTRLSSVLLHILLKRADIITVCSRSLQKKLAIIFPDCVNKAVVVPNANPINIESMHASPPAIKGLPVDFILSVASLIHRKGNDILIRALAEAGRRGRRLNLVIVGGGPERDKLLLLARDLGLADQVWIVGEVPHDEIAWFYQRCKFFALATRAEGMPLSIAEAMSFAKAVVSTMVDGIPELVSNGETGLLVAAEDFENLAERLIELDKSPLLRDRLGQSAREYVTSEHTWAQFTDRYIKLYMKALQPSAKQARD